MAAAYVADEGNAYNSLYERPGMLGLLGSVAGARVLDLGCGAGTLSAELIARGASRVVGIDISPRMITLAHSRFASSFTGADASPEFVVGDVADGGLASFEDAAFDAVAASLVMHYVRDWSLTLRELARVVRRGGHLVFSTHHPEMTARFWPPGGDPNAIELLHDCWTKGGEEFAVRFYRRSFATMEASIAASGWTLDRWVTPYPLQECETADPEAWERLTTQPWFVFGVLTR